MGKSPESKLSSIVLLQDRALDKHIAGCRINHMKVQCIPGMNTSWLWYIIFLIHCGFGLCLLMFYLEFLHQYS